MDGYVIEEVFIINKSDLMMVLTEWSPHIEIEDLSPKDKSPEEIFFIDLMSRLDILKLTQPLQTEGDIERWSRSIKQNELSELSVNTMEYLGTSRVMTVYAEFDGGVERRLGLRNRDNEVVFTLSKETRECSVQTGKRKGGRFNGIWEREKSDDIPKTDALLLAIKGFPLY